MTGPQRRMLRRSMPWIFMTIFLAIWEILCVALDVQEIILPRPSRIFETIVLRADILLIFCLQTLWTTIIGFLLAIAGGLVLGLLIGASPFIYSGLYPLLIAFNAIPKVAIVPILMIWVGVGALPAVITAFVISFFPIVVNVATGLATIEPEMRDVLRSLGANQREILTKVGIPRAMPYLFASLKIAITLAFIGTVISETVGGNRGIGFLLATSLLAVIGIFDLLNAARASAADPQWLGFYNEAYLVVAVVYFVICFGASRYSRWLENKLAAGARRP